MKRPSSLLCSCLTLILILAISNSSRAQRLLNKPVTITAVRKPLGEVMRSMEVQAGFLFSYNTSLVRKDSLVSLAVKNQTLRQVLDQLFDGKFEYRETGKYLILQKNASGQFWYVSGYVIDEKTGQRVPNASVYEPQQLVAALSNDQGYFRLKLKQKYETTALQVSKEWYDEKAIEVMPGADQEVTVNITPRVFELDPVVVTRYSRIEGTWYGRMFISSRDRMQSINLGKFFVDKPFQFSLIPSIGTHGKMASQVTNKFSLNMIGGYTAAVDGVEIGSVFNIVKKDMQYVQAAGLFNIVGGKVKGVQVAGLFNQVLDSVEGIQAAGLANIVSERMEGVQAAGLYNHVTGQMKGIQIAGLANLSNTCTGIQLAGFANITRGQMKGMQLSGFVNYTKHLKGFQLGILNIADSSDGCSLGLVNIVRRNGYHKLSVSTNEVLDLNLAVKTGTSKMYTMLIAGMNVDADHKAYSYGAGLGTEFHFRKRWGLSPEVSVQHLYLGDWEHLNLLNRLQLNLEFKVNRYLMLFGGSSYNIYYSDQRLGHDGYQSDIRGYHPSRLDQNTTGWFGWTVGLSVF